MLQAQAPMASCYVPEEHNLNVEKSNDQSKDLAPVSVPSTDYQAVELNENYPTSVNKSQAIAVTSTDVPNERKRYDTVGPSNSLVESSEAKKSWNRKGAGDGTTLRQLRDVVLILPLLPLN